MTDPGARICGHEHRTHYLGGGIYVCFRCWLTALCGARKATR